MAAGKLVTGRAKMNYACMIIASGLLVSTPTGANVSPDEQDFQMEYKILPLKSNTPVGVYRISQFWQPTSKNWLQRGTISFNIKMPLNRYHYDYSDEVTYSGNKALSYSLKENNNGTFLQVVGESDKEKQNLNLSLHTESGNKQKSISNTDFDYTTFTLRFPSPCSKHPEGETQIARIMRPQTGVIDAVQIHYLGYQPVTLPGESIQRHDLCLIEITSNDKQTISQSWMNAEGYLVYAIYPRYRLLLHPQTSNSAIHSVENAL